MIAPLIVTLQIAEPPRSHFTALRNRHFPPERNHLDAHVTMFHHLSGVALDMILATLSDAASETSISEVDVTGLRFTGRGVAFTADNIGILALRERLARSFATLLTPQDQQPWRPHITVQNKVDPATAAALFAQLQTDFQPFSFEAPGLALWRYLGGPWAHVADFPFTPRQTASWRRSVGEG